MALHRDVCDAQVNHFIGQLYIISFILDPLNENWNMTYYERIFKS